MINITTVAIIVHYINGSKQQVVHLKCTQCFTSNIFNKKNAVKKKESTFLY